MRIDLINTVNALMISEMIISPLIRYSDPIAFLDRHYFAPRAKSEEELFSCFRGGWYNLAERFTDFTKVLLLCTFYAAFYPLTYFLGAAILFAQYCESTIFLAFFVSRPTLTYKIRIMYAQGWINFCY